MHSVVTSTSISVGHACAATTRHSPALLKVSKLPQNITVALLQETADKELVVLHDLHSVLAASAPYEINQGILQELAGAGLQLEAPASTTTVSDAAS